MGLLKTIMNFLRIPNRLGRIDYSIISIFIFFGWVCVAGMLMAIVTVMDDQNRNIVVSVLYMCGSIVVLIKLICAIARLHDCGASGWWVILLAPFTIFSVLLLMILPGTKGANRFGEQPSS